MLLALACYQTVGRHSQSFHSLTRRAYRLRVGFAKPVFPLLFPVSSPDDYPLAPCFKTAVAEVGRVPVRRPDWNPEILGPVVRRNKLHGTAVRDFTPVLSRPQSPSPWRYPWLAGRQRVWHACGGWRSLWASAMRVPAPFRWCKFAQSPTECDLEIRASSSVCLRTFPGSAARVRISSHLSCMHPS